MIAKFNKQDLEGVKKGRRVKLTVEGEFGEKYYYGPMTFEGSDKVSVIKLWKPKWWK